MNLVQHSSLIEFSVILRLLVDGSYHQRLILIPSEILAVFVSTTCYFEIGSRTLTGPIVRWADADDGIHHVVALDAVHGWQDTWQNSGILLHISGSLGIVAAASSHRISFQKVIVDRWRVIVNRILTGFQFVAVAMDFRGAACFLRE